MAENREGENNENDTPETYSGVIYTVEEIPPWYLCILFGFQHFLTASGSLISLPILLGQFYCLDQDYVALSEIISTVFFVSGIMTLIQTTFGVRLPIVQGTSASFIAPIIAIMNQPEWACPYTEARSQHGENVSFTDIGLPEVGSAGHAEIWQKNIREIQGAIMVASLFEVVLGFTGVIGFALRYFGPIVITSTLTLIGLSLFQTGAALASQQWWIALMTMVLITVFSQYLRGVKIPFVSCDKRMNLTVSKLPVFTLFPVVLAMLLAWAVCAILTVTGALPDDPGEWGYLARTDRSTDVLRDAKWFRVPYPGQWGLPTVTASSVFGILAAILVSILESIGDYYACAKISGAPPPPAPAINRGIMTEGLGCFIAGLWGTGQGTTSFGQNTGTIGITKVGSRFVVQVGACIMIVLGCLGKFGALFASVPQAIIGGMFMITFGMVTGVGLSSLQYVDLNSPRNIYIVGVSVFLGLSLPVWVKGNPDAIDTGNDVVDQILTVLFSTNMFVGALVAFVLDNTVPGTLKERGIIAWLDDGTAEGDIDSPMSTVYDLPLIQRRLNDISVLKYIPICPTFLRQRKERQHSHVTNEANNSGVPYSGVSDQVTGVSNSLVDANNVDVEKTSL